MSEGEWLGRIGDWAWERRDDIARRLTDVYRWFRGSEIPATARSVLIIGPGGVGKTTLGRLLMGEYDLLFDVPGDYEESIHTESYTLKDDPETEIVVPPGQQHRRDTTWADLQGNIANGRFRGIIFLAAYGYHTLGQISYKDHHLYAGKKADFLNAYLHDCRNDEINVLRRLAPHVQQCRERVWMLTLVTKQDLWWPNASEVERFYRQGEYGVEIDQMIRLQDLRDIRHEVLFTSLVISRFTTGKGELLVPNVAGYDQNLQVASLRRLFETMDALRRWEATE